MPTNVLIVDDDAPLRKLFHMYFQNFLPPTVDVSSVDIVDDYTSAIEKIREKNYDLLILDGLGGDCFRIHEDIKDIPHGNVVILSSNTSLEDEAARRNIPFYVKSNGLNDLDKIVATYILLKDASSNNTSITQ